VRCNSQETNKHTSKPNLGALPIIASVFPTHIPSLSVCLHVYKSIMYDFFCTCLCTCVLCTACFVIFNHISPLSVYSYTECVNPYVSLPFSLHAFLIPSENTLLSVAVSVFETTLPSISVCTWTTYLSTLSPSLCLSAPRYIPPKILIIVISPFLSLSLSLSLSLRLCLAFCPESLLFPSLSL